MAAVRTSSEVALNRVAIVAVLVVTLIFLAPIYWITSTAFKPLVQATAIGEARQRSLVGLPLELVEQHRLL